MRSSILLSLVSWFSARFTQHTLKRNVKYLPLSYGEIEKYRLEALDHLEKISKEQVTDFAQQTLPKYLMGIAASQIPPSEIPKLYELISLTYKKYIEQSDHQNRNLKSQKKYPKNKVEVIVPIEVKQLETARELIYAIAFNERLLWPTSSLGISLDEGMDTVTKKTIVVRCISYARCRLAKHPSMWNENTQEIYQGIVARLTKSTSKITGQPFKIEDFPSFPQLIGK